MRGPCALAAWLDRWESRVRLVGERLGYPQAWLQEFCTYRGDSRMTLEEFWVRYTLLRMEMAPRFAAVKTESDARAFYTDSEYMLWRNLVHRRHSAWRRVLWTMRGRQGGLLEIGCGIAPVSAWVAPRKPGWRFWLHDVKDSPHLRYAQWRLRGREWTMGRHRVKVMTLLDVLEHLVDPLATVHHALSELAPGGYLHWNAVRHEQAHELNLAAPSSLAAAVRHLTETLALVWEGEDGHRVSRNVAGD